MTNGRKRPRTSGTRDFLDTPIYELVDRHRATLEKIKTRDDAEYWGHILIGEYYPEVPNSRSASGKMAALVGLTDYLDFYCRDGYYDLLKNGKTLQEARKILGERRARNLQEFARLLGTKKRPKREVRAKVGIRGEVVIPKSLLNAMRLAPGSEVTLSSEGDRIVLRAVRNDVLGTLEKIARSGPSVRKVPPPRRTRANSERVVRDWSQETLREAGPVHVHPVSSATS